MIDVYDESTGIVLSFPDLGSAELFGLTGETGPADIRPATRADADGSCLGLRDVLGASSR